MQVELKTYGHGKDATVHKLVGKLTIKADDKDDAEFLAMFSGIVMRHQLFQILTWLGDALIDDRATADEKRQLAEMVARFEKEKTHGMEPIKGSGGGS